MTPEVIFMACFLLFVALMLAFDLGVINKKNHIISFKEALIWTCVWIGMALLFYVLIRFHAEWIHGAHTIEDLQVLNIKHGHNLTLNLADYDASLEMYRKAMSLEYITGYLIEKALSVDNIFVMIMIFLSFKVDPKYYHKVLFWGILGAVVMRFLFIFLSAALIQRFAWILWVFGGILIFTGIKMFLERKKNDDDVNMSTHPVVRFASKYLPVTRNFYAGRFFIKLRGRNYLTPLFLVLLIIEFSDVIFAVDSIPAIFSVTLDPYIVFFSNIFAILGLRSLFFVLSNIMNKFAYLKLGLAVLLVFIGVKMLLHGIFHIEIGTGLSLLIIVGILGASIAASLLFPPKEEQDPFMPA